MKNQILYIMYLQTKEDNIYRIYVTREKEIFFFFFWCGKQSIENKPYFYYSFSLTNFLFATKYWKMWKIIFTESFPIKQTKCKG